MKTTWRTEWPHWVLIAAMFALAAWSWDRAPDRIAVHWGLTGQPDRWGGKFEGLLAVPLLSIGIYALMLLLPRLDPGRANYASFAGPYRWLRLAVLSVMTGVYLLIVLWTVGRRVPIETAVPILVGALFVGLGNIMGKVRPNWFVGIRTPWTLSSKVAWDRTHRAGGWLFVLLGALLVACGFVKAAWMLGVVIAVGAVGVLGLTVWSYLLWRGDPDKTPPAGTLPANDGR